MTTAEKVITKAAIKALQVIRLPPTRTVSQWADGRRYLCREYSSEPGFYRLSKVPYAAEPMDCANDPTVRVTVLMWAAQTTKTTLVENVLAYFIAQDPAPILMVQPTIEMGQAWSKERFTPTIRDTKSLRELIADPKSRDSGNTIQLKTFPGGNLAIVGANAPAGLAGRPRRVILCDEVDRYPASAGTEGDPIALAIRRSESFWNSVIFLTSTPTVKGLSRIESEFEQTDKRFWFVPCHKCGEFQTLKWSQVRWEKDKPETAKYHCEKCDCEWDDADRVKAIKLGEWRATAKFSGKRGYFLNGIYSPFKGKRGFKDRLHQMVSDFLESKAGGVEQLKTWTNTFLAETWQDEGESVEPTELESRCENYSPISLPEAVVFVGGGADVQKDRIELEFIGLGFEDETWGIEVIKTYGDTEKPETWQRFGNELNRVFRRIDGVELHPTAIAIDFHYKPKVVKDWSIRHGTRCFVFPVIGMGQHQAALVQARTGQDNFRHWSVASDAMKDIIFSRLKIHEQGARYMHFPRGFGYTEEWFRQLTSERVVTKHTRGFPKRIYEKQSGARNEALDMRVYAFAAFEILRPDLGNIAAQLKPTKPIESSKATLPTQFQPRHNSWVSGFK